MGTVTRKSHHPRSSSMSFALRWKHENIGIISLVSTGFVILLFMFVMLLYDTSSKTVTLVVNGKSTAIRTNEWEVGRLLAEQGVHVGEHDRVSANLHAKLSKGDRIEINQAIPIRLTADGKSATVYTTGRTVQNALQDLQLSLGPYDKVYPDLSGSLAANSDLTIVRVEKVLENQEQIVPYDVVEKNDAQLAKGKQQTVQSGKPGVKIATLEKIYEDGRLTAVKVIGSSIKTEAVDKIVAVGIKKPVTVLSASSPVVETVTKKGITFGVKQILKDVVLTAYDAGVESTGKSPKHPQYGITYTGTRVQEGRTIAVDPKVIPLGWWVYIEGIGFRRAEDIGGGVKGKWIDIYYDDGKYAERFGMKKGATVYVIGSKKPTSDQEEQ